MKIALAQCNFKVGDIAGNAEKIAHIAQKNTRENCDLIVFSEMSIIGYPPEDLVLRKRFQQAAMAEVEKLAELTKAGPAMIVGGLWQENDQLFNTVFLLDNGKIIHQQYKHNLPNYGVFDEKRVFHEGVFPAPVKWRDIHLGILICEDMWSQDVTKHLKEKNAEILISINASPYQMGKAQIRLDVAKSRISETSLPLIYVNQVGGQDELVFDGKSFVMATNGKVTTSLKSFEEDFVLCTLNKTPAGWIAEKGVVEKRQSDEETIYNAMVLGLRDYVEKNKFPGVVLGLSGGIDSAITAAVAVDAIGAGRVHAIMMPSPYTSKESLEDAEACAKLLGIALDEIAISPAMDSINTLLAPIFKGLPPDTTEENIQSRLRGNILMAVSNKKGALVLTTGNKSEMSVGYATLYGDMCGGYSVLKDVYKTTVYKITSWRNAMGRVIPERIITKAPSAELKHNQTDQDSLPPYDILDAILLRLVEQQLSVAEIVEQGYAREIVEKIAKLLYRAEYKRRQAPPGVKITGMSFGRDRRYPITDGWVE